MASCIKHVLSVALLVGLLFTVLAFHDAEEEAKALTHFFEEMDHNNDGQVDEAEAKKYIEERIGGREFDTGPELTEAFHHMVTNIDKDRTQEGNTISVAEVKQHLQNLQHAVSVKEWVQHGLGLPQYAETFRENMITAADFPLLVNDKDNIFEDELKVSSRLHKNQIIRGMKRLILGLGELPSPPQVISCRQESETRSVLEWASPIRSGNPAVHKYLVERLELNKGGGSWIVASEIEAHLNQQQYAERISHWPGRHHFRIIAWTAYGPSQYAVFDECRPLDPSQRPPQLTDGRSYSDYRLEPQSVAELAQIVSSIKRNSESERANEGSSRAGYWSLFVVAVSIALRILTSRNIAIVKCCFLWKLEHIALMLRMKSLAKRISRIKRQECKQCKLRCPKVQMVLEEDASSQHPALLRKKAVSHKIEPTQHFGLEESHMVFSKSSPALGDQKINYSNAEWDLNETAAALDKLPIPEYKVSSWDEADSAFSKSTSSSSMTTPSDVPSGLIEGQCAFDGCLREWKGVFQFRNRWSRHFCSICLRTYCYEHTHISPHGSFGFCGQHSSCVCVVCFPKLPPATRAQLEATNKLDKSPAKRDDLERGCARRDGHLSVRSLLGLRKQQPGKTSRNHREKSTIES